MAELKIRPSRFARVRDEVQIKDGQILEIAEFFHPRVQEIADTLPAAAGRWLMRTRWARRLVDRAPRKGKIVKTTSMGGFLLLYALAKLKPLRRRSLRFAGEQAALAQLARPRRRDRARRLCARPGDCAHAQPGEGLRRHPSNAGGPSSISSRRSSLACAIESNGAATLAGLIKAALADEDGDALDKAIAELDATRRVGAICPCLTALALLGAMSEAGRNRVLRGSRHALRPRSIRLRLSLHPQARSRARRPGGGPHAARAIALQQRISSRNYCGDHVPRGLQGALRGSRARVSGPRPYQRQGARVAAARPWRIVGDLRPGHPSTPT